MASVGSENRLKTRFWSIMQDNILFDFLKTHAIEYNLFKHQPVYTTNEKPILADGGSYDEMPGKHSKNLFLKDSHDSYFLVSVIQEKSVDLKALNTLLGCGRFSFGKPDEMKQLLSLEPGSVTPFGLLFDKQNKVSFILDEDFLAGSFVNFHPMRNDMTIGLKPQDFLRAMELMGHAPRVITIPEKKV